MKLIIDIPEYTFERITEYYDALPEGSTVDANVCYIANGTPIPDNATVCDIEDIKADIEAARYGLINDGLDVALRIIDKHCPSCGAKMESEDKE